jgi:cation transport ATPase
MKEFFGSMLAMWAYDKLVGTVESAARESIALQESTNRLSINARGAGEEFVDPTVLRKEFEQAAVATPCPLILATPIAFASGISQAAKRGIIVKSGEAIEQLAKAKSFLFDKTGTLTLGEPQVVKAESYSEKYRPKEIIALAASLDQLSAHVLARSLKSHADEKKITLEYPDDFQEDVGNGVMGKIGTETLFVGKLAYLKSKKIPIPEQYQRTHQLARASGKLVIYVADKKQIIGSIFFQDVVRTNIKKVFATLRQHAVRVIMVTGDKAEVAHRIAHEANISEVFADCLPEKKVEVVGKVREMNMFAK